MNADLETVLAHRTRMAMIAVLAGVAVALGVPLEEARQLMTGRYEPAFERIQQAIERDVAAWQAQDSATAPSSSPLPPLSSEDASRAVAFAEDLLRLTGDHQDG